ncbi:hypothetical protein NAT51_07280 [Flavobacterium amniphilum]|uniref:hypothetical protein n=1 Tax=Flavobacterium amniphilum TaxID=1834035 RepID=UPI002029C5BE|nr:hypothetical protein [Flavobacterium amniphilum]MCL9805317.1 hypothetical protein [Flavobacterium amniphilum]
MSDSGKITIIAKNIKGNANGSVRYDAKKISNISGGAFTQNGETSGLNHVGNTTPKEGVGIKIVKLEGPFDDAGKQVKNVKVGEFCTFKATPSRKPIAVEIPSLKWALKPDDKEQYQVKGAGIYNRLIDNKIVIKLRMPAMEEKVKVYAFYNKPSETVCVEAKILSTCDAVMVVGSELHEPTYGNKMRFFAQAVRTLLLNSNKWKKVSLIYFNYVEPLEKTSYNKGEIDEVKKSLSSKYDNSKIDFVPVKNITEMINKINSYEDIQQLHFYSHGMPSKITFGLGHITANVDGPQTFTFSEISKIKKNVFAKNAQIHSYACRTGNAQKNVSQNDFTPYYTVMYFAGKADFSENFTNRELAQKRYGQLKKSFSNVYFIEPSVSPSDARPKESLAQKMANQMGISVFAYITRSDYQPTWHGNFQKIEIDDETVEKGWFGAKFWQDGDHALWNATGAINGVKGGTTPKGLDNKLIEFKPE